MITQSLRATIANMTEPELIEVLECIEVRAEKLPAPKLFDTVREDIHDLYLEVKDDLDKARADLDYVREQLKVMLERID